LVNPNKRVFIITGEASGDLHASKLIEEVRKKNPAISFVGIGGEKMRASGADILVDIKKLAVMGFFEIIPHLWTFYKTLTTVREQLRSHPPDLLILIDFSAFNLRVAKTAKELGIKVLYYIGPQVWAWRTKRVEIIKQNVDLMAVIQPFEFDFYQKAQVPVKLVRNSLLDYAVSSLTIQQAREKLELDPNKKTIGLLPGSRRGELKYLLPLILASAERLYQDQQDLQFVLPIASTLKRSDFDPYLANIKIPIHLVNHQTIDVLRGADAVIATSGTVTFEAALMNVPMVIVYRMHPFNYAIISRVVKTKYVGLCNIIAKKEIVKELIQAVATVENVTAEVKKILQNESYRQEMKNQLSLVRKQLEAAADNRIADIVVEMLEHSIQKISPVR